MSLFKNLRCRLSHRLQINGRHFAESLGIERYSMPAYDDIDRKLQKYLPAKGFFIEAGGLDGFEQSNTYYLERLKGWQGVIVEALPGYRKTIQKNRTRSRVYSYALVEEGFEEDFIEIIDAGAMSTVSGSLPQELERNHMEAASKYASLAKVKVPVRTLSSIIEDAGNPAIDFLSLDVEGLELRVLKGLDFSKHAPKWILIEIINEAQKAEYKDFLGERGYEWVDQLSYRDHLFKKQS